MLIDNAGNIILSGNYEKTVDMNTSGSPLNLISNGTFDILLAVYNPDMELVWARGIGGAGFDEGYNITVDQNQNIYITGFFSGTVNFNNPGGTNNLTTTGNGDEFFMASYAIDASYRWAFSLPTYIGAAVSRIPLLFQNNQIHVGLPLFATIDADPGSGTNSIASNGFLDILYAQYSVNGAFISAKTIGGSSGNDKPLSMSFTQDNELIIAGMFTGNVDFDWSAGENLLTANGEDVFVIRYGDGVAPTNTNHIEELKNVQLFPNPAEQTLYVGNLDKDEAIIIMDVTGRIVYTEKTNSDWIRIDLSMIESGVYLLRNGLEIKKFIKQ